MMKKIFSLIVTSSVVMAVSAQDLHFSQFMNSPLVTNPANTGFIPDGDYRIGINYRNQWSSITNFPYKTMSAFGDMQIMPNGDNTGWVGVGGLILRDVAGTGNLTSTKLYGSVAYHQMIDAGSLLSAGFNVGWSNKRINSENLTFPDQWNGKFFDVKAPTTGKPSNNSISYIDLQAGINYAYFPNDQMYLNVGFSTMHINRPRETFFDTQIDNVDNRISMRHNAFINGSFKLNEQWIFNPNVYFSTMAKSWELVAGFNAHYNLSGDGEKILITGLYYRHQDAVIPMIGLGFKDYTVNFTYDATMSTLKNYNNTRGAFEFSLIKQGAFDTYQGNRRESMCPSFRY